MTGPQRPVRVLPQTRRRGPAINHSEPKLGSCSYSLSYNQRKVFCYIKFSDLTLISKISLINFRDYTCCPDVIIEALLSASKTLPAIVVLRFLQTISHPVRLKANLLCSLFTHLASSNQMINNTLVLPNITSNLQSEQR